MFLVTWHVPASCLQMVAAVGPKPFRWTKSADYILSRSVERRPIDSDERSRLFERHTGRLSVPTHSEDGPALAPLDSAPAFRYLPALGTGRGCNLPAVWVPVRDRTSPFGAVMDHWSARGRRETPRSST